MNPVKKLMSWWRGPSSDPESLEAAHLREDQATIRISQNTPNTPLGSPTNLPTTPDMLDSESPDDHR